MLAWLKHEQRLPIAIIGDLILDEYLEGNVERISPEAPVPIHKVTRSFHQAGGAANAARNIQALGAQAILFGCIGKDASADTILSLLENCGITHDGIVTVHDRPTIKKTRIASGTQQMLRIDWESIQAIGKEYQDTLLANLKLKQFSALLISDYGKGGLPTPLLKRLFELAKERQIPTVVDPKGTDFSRYVGCDLITPNLKEAREALALDALSIEGLEPGAIGEKLGRLLQERFGLKDVLVTMGAQGMTYVPFGEGPICYDRAKAREVFDVSGAGDTVAAVMTLAKASPELSIQDSVLMANIAGARVVEKWGTQPIERTELEESLGYSEPGSHSETKIYTREALLAKLDQLRARGKKIVFTNGCFDILHVGHLTYIEQAKALGDVLVLGVNSDRSIRSLKGPKRPIVGEQDRLRLLAGLNAVDYVFLFDETSVQKTIEMVLPDILVKGGDYTVEGVVGADVVMRNGGLVKTLSLVAQKSTTSVIEKILQSES